MVDTVLGFRQVVRGEMLPSFFWRPCQFYETDIMVDAIISFPWLVSHNIGVFPHLKALAILEPEFSLLLGVNPKRRAINYLSRREGQGQQNPPRPLRGGGGAGCGCQTGRKNRRRWVPIQSVTTGVGVEERENSIFQLDKLRLHIPPEEQHATLDFLTERELAIIAQKLEKSHQKS